MYIYFIFLIVSVFYCLFLCIMYCLFEYYFDQTRYPMLVLISSIFVSYVCFLLFSCNFLNNKCRAISVFKCKKWSMTLEIGLVKSNRSIQKVKIPNARKKMKKSKGVIRLRSSNDWQQNGKTKNYKQRSTKRYTEI